MSAVRKDLATLISLLKVRGFIDHSAIKHNGQEYLMSDYGPPGTLLRQNILKQWWDAVVCKQNNVYAVESPLLQPSDCIPEKQITRSSDEAVLRDQLQKDCTSKYLQVLKLSNGTLPFSIASVGSCFSWKENTQTTEPDLKNLFFGFSNYTRLIVQNYTSPAKSYSVFDYWLQLRLSWWKQFSNNPAKFSVISASNNNHNSTNGQVSTQASGATNGKEQSQNRIIVYEFPWGVEPIEEVSNLGDGPFHHVGSGEIEKYMGKTSGKLSCLPYCIECDTNIESAAAAWIIDSYVERPIISESNTSKTKLAQVFKLHSKIAPYQVSLAVQTSPVSNELRHICTHLEKEFKKANISLFNASDHGSTIDAHFKRNDQLGIPYTVIVNERTPTDGLVVTRHRDTQIQVPSHMTEIVNDLKHYLDAQLVH